MSMIICLNCSNLFNGIGERKFCSSSCSISYLNKNRIITEEYREKSRKGTLEYNRKNDIYPKTKVEVKHCSECNKLFFTKLNGRLFCNKICQNLALSKTCTGKKKQKIHIEVNQQKHF